MEVCPVRTACVSELVLRPFGSAVGGARVAHWGPEVPLRQNRKPPLNWSEAAFRIGVADGARTREGLSRQFPRAQLLDGWRIRSRHRRVQIERGFGVVLLNHIATVEKFARAAF